MLSKNSSKVVKFDSGRHLLVLQYVSRLGVALQASSFITKDRNRKANEFVSSYRTKTYSLAKSKSHEFDGYK
jgi:hypothetical protein